MRKGQTIIEVMTAVGIAIVGLLALVQVGTKSVNNAGYSSRQSQATSLASRGLENVRLKKEELGWLKFKSTYNVGPVCGENLNAGCCSSGEFTSCVTFNYVPTNGIDQMTVLSEVSWQDSGRTAKVKQETVIVRR